MGGLGVGIGCVDGVGEGCGGGRLRIPRTAWEGRACQVPGLDRVVVEVLASFMLLQFGLEWWMQMLLGEAAVSWKEGLRISRTRVWLLGLSIARARSCNEGEPQTSHSVRWPRIRLGVELGLLLTG